jgi:hypothetical protein
MIISNWDANDELTSRTDDWRDTGKRSRGLVQRHVMLKSL